MFFMGAAGLAGELTMETMNRSRAATLTAPGKIELRDVPIPVPGPHELLVRVRFAGICGTDLALVDGGYETDLPLVIGHEFCGRVVAAGEAVTGDFSDAFVTAEINVTCLSRKVVDPCRMCLSSMSAHCQYRSVIGIRERDGAFADHLVVPAANVHRLPKELSPKAGVLVEPLAAAIRTFEVTPLSPGDHVVVLGAGRLGLLVAKAARSHGAHVIAVSGSPEKRELALRFGVASVVEAGPTAREQVLALTDGIGANVVVECSGAPDGLATAVTLVRPRGVIAEKSTAGRPTRKFDPTIVVVNELTIQGSRCGPFAKAIERLKSGLVPVDDYVSGVFPLSEIEAALEAARGGIKILIEAGPD